MKDILAIWIIVQLVVIGLVGGTSLKDIRNGEYECTHNEKLGIGFVFTSTVFPLVYFVDSSLDETVNDYCSNQLENE